MSEIEVDVCGLPGQQALRIKLREGNAPVNLSIDVILRGGRVMSPGAIGPGGADTTVVLIPLDAETPQ